MRLPSLPLVLLLATHSAAAAEGDWHTSPDKWAKPRLYHQPFDEKFADRISVDRCPAPTLLPKREMAPNDAYWYAAIYPDRTKSGPWNTDILVHTERDYLVRIRFKAIHYCRDFSWINEKLLRIRVWWGRIVATDLIVDVEQERIIYKEMVWDGTIAYYQHKEAVAP